MENSLKFNTNSHDPLKKWLLNASSRTPVSHAWCDIRRYAL